MLGSWHCSALLKTCTDRPSEAGPGTTDWLWKKLKWATELVTSPSPLPSPCRASQQVICRPPWDAQPRVDLDEMAVGTESAESDGGFPIPPVLNPVVRRRALLQRRPWYVPFSMWRRYLRHCIAKWSGLGAIAGGSQEKRREQAA